MADIFGAIAGGAMQMGIGAFNNWLAGQKTDYDREETYRFGEMQAENADRRTRALYNDFYSPQALARQYKETGLSPSLMFGGTPGQGGMSGAQAGGISMQTPYMPMSMIEGVQAANIMAQTEKTKAETKNIEKDTDLKLLEQQYNGWRNQEKQIEYNLANLWVSDIASGEKTSFYEVAINSNSYEDFIEKAREVLKKGNMDTELMMTGTETGQKTMREIYMSANRLETEIQVLSETGVSAKFQENILQCLKQEGFIKQNAETCVKQLKAAAEGAELSTEQKGAWNRVIDRLQRKNSTAADYAIVAAMILNQAASNWISTGITIKN